MHLSILVREGPPLLAPQSLSTVPDINVTHGSPVNDRQQTGQFVHGLALAGTPNQELYHRLYESETRTNGTQSTKQTSVGYSSFSIFDGFDFYLT